MVSAVGVAEELGRGGRDGAWGAGSSCFRREGGEWVCGNAPPRCASKCVSRLDGLKPVGVDDLGVVRVGVRLKVTTDDRGWRPNSDVFLFDLVVVDGDLYANLAVDRVQSRVDILDVVLMHDLLLNDGVVLALTGELGVHEPHLGGEDGLQSHALENGDAGAGVHGNERQEEPVNQDVAGAEQAEQAKRGRIRIPDLHLPHIACLVGVRSLLGSFGTQEALDYAQ